MKPETQIDFPLEGKDPRNYNWLYKTIAVLIIAAVLMGVGAFLDKPPKRLPPNTYCQEALAVAAEGLKVSNAQISAALKGEDAPAPDLTAISKAAKSCSDNKELYQYREATK